MSSKTTLHAALGGIAMATGLAASAQSSVTLAGQIGAGVGMKNHQGAGNGSPTEVTDNLMAASWLRFSILEDLGGGMRAHARIETGINAATDRVIRSTDVNNVSGSNLHATPLAVSASTASSATTTARTTPSNTA